MPSISAVSLPSDAPAWTRAAAAIALAVAVTATPSTVAADYGSNFGNNSNAFNIHTLSTAPHLVTGGNVLVRIEVPRNVSMQGTRVTLNGVDITSRFMAETSTRSMTGLVTGLRRGNNTLAAGARNARSNRGGSQNRTLTITNYPITGPIISGPHEEPFICQTESFNLPTTGGNLGPPIDQNCSIATRVDYVYWNTSVTPNAFRALNTSAAVPTDVAMTTTNAGKTVRFIVRVETGTINRAIYQIAVLHDPYTEGQPTWARRPAGWNGKLIYQHGGGCQGGWYTQGEGTGGVLTMSHLGRGFARASSSLNVFGNNCNDLLASETTIMVKEHFVENYGVPKWTIGTGSSGGAYQSGQTADNYPGIFDGIVTMSTFPDVTTGMVTLHDSRLLDTLFNTTLPGQFTQEEQRAIAGYRQFNEIVFLSRSSGTSALRMDPLAVWDPMVPTSFRYEPTSNPFGARATVYDHTINVYGEDGNGFARRPMDNVGVQYGLLALNGGAITVDQFLTVNERVGGVDIDFNSIPQRTTADIGALRRAYKSGRVLNMGNGLSEIPLIQQHGAGDPAVNGDIHLKFYAFGNRQRLINKNGHARNQVITAPFNVANNDYFDQMNRWLDAIFADESDRPQWAKVVANKPADVVDACWDASGNKLVETNASAFGTTPCNTLYPAGMTPNLVAGAPIESTIIKCQLKPINPTDYQVAFTAQQMNRLNNIFSDGVCDWSKPGVGESFESVPWASFGPSRVNLIYDINNPRGR